VIAINSLFRVQKPYRLRYIHRTPLPGGLVKTLADYAWSGHQGYLSQSTSWHWLYHDLLLSMLAAKKSQARRNYLDFVCCGEPAPIGRFYCLKKLPSILGGEAF
jgi:putative transposase